MSGSFVHMDFPDADDPELVYLDTPAGDLFLEPEPELRRCKSMFEHLQACRGRGRPSGRCAGT
ncbi:Scr1 family TA system antitoxin-like transcriptional regulator [Streptomyces sp. NPDC015232]